LRKEFRLVNLTQRQLLRTIKVIAPLLALGDHDPMEREPTKPPAATPTSWADKLEALYEATHSSQAKLRRHTIKQKTPIDGSTISNWSTGKRDPTREQIAIIAPFFGMTPGQFIDWQPGDPMPRLVSAEASLSGGQVITEEKAIQRIDYWEREKRPGFVSPLERPDFLKVVMALTDSEIDLSDELLEELARAIKIGHAKSGRN
jgi:hypothetical protein